MTSAASAPSDPESDNTLGIPVFDPTTSTKFSTWLIIAPRRSGKTRLLRHLLYATRHNYDFGMAMVGTQSTADMMHQHLPQDFIYKEGYDLGQAKNFLSTFRTLSESPKRRSGLLLLDDCIFDATVMKSQPIRTLHLNGRHFYTTVMCTTQYAIAVPTIVRSNLDYIIALSEPNLNNIKNLYQHYFGHYDSFSQFRTVFEQVTRNYGAVVLDKTSSPPTVKYFKARLDLPDFKIGRPIYYWMSGWFKELAEKKNKTKGKGIGKK